MINHSSQVHLENKLKFCKLVFKMDVLVSGRSNTIICLVDSPETYKIPGEDEDKSALVAPSVELTNVSGMLIGCSAAVMVIMIMVS